MTTLRGAPPVAARPRRGPSRVVRAVVVGVVVAAAVATPAGSTVGVTTTAPVRTGVRSPVPATEQVVPPRLTRPVPGAVVRPFAPPPGPYGPGHRGVDLAAAPGTPVRNAAVGTIAFAGVVAGTAWIAVAHGPRVTTTYGPVAVALARVGSPVARGAVIATAAGTGHGGAVLHLGLRVDGRYVDPGPLLAPAWSVRLLPPPAVIDRVRAARPAASGGSATLAGGPRRGPPRPRSTITHAR